MNIEARLNVDLKAAMREKNKDGLACIRQVKARMQETVNAKGFAGEVDDKLWQTVIASYVKNLEKGIDELAAGGERSATLRGQYQAEIDYLEQFLPKMMGESETRELVRGIIEALGITDKKQLGRVMGAVMKDHKGKADPGLVRRLAEELLS